MRSMAFVAALMLRDQANSKHRQILEFVRAAEPVMEPSGGVPETARDTPKPGGQSVATGLLQLYDLLVEVTRKPAPT